MARVMKLTERDADILFGFVCRNIDLCYVILSESKCILH